MPAVLLHLRAAVLISLEEIIWICVICVKHKIKNPSILGPSWDPQNKWISESCCDWHISFLESLEYYWIVFYENTLVNRDKHNLKNRELWGVLVRNIYPVTSVYSVLVGLFSLFFLVLFQAACSFGRCCFCLCLNSSQQNGASIQTWCLRPGLAQTWQRWQHKLRDLC